MWLWRFMQLNFTPFLMKLLDFFFLAFGFLLACCSYPHIFVFEVLINIKVFQMISFIFILPFTNMENHNCTCELNILVAPYAKGMNDHQFMHDLYAWKSIKSWRISKVHLLLVCLNAGTTGQLIFFFSSNFNPESGAFRWSRASTSE